MTERTQQFTWGDPMIGAQVAPTLSGIDYLRGIQRGDYPPAPIAVLMNMTLSELEVGRIVFSAMPAEYHYNPIGMVHGGFAATLLDSAMACAIQSTLPLGVIYTTLELKVNYVRAISLETGLVYSEGKVIHAGKRVATAEGRVTDANGKLYAHATTTCMVVTA
ncbi:MAG: PaaI family thioesterase [Anaerolineae bacterium]|jgi:uncharacterized protein (TIGR00369 family)|nr:PaaI family thioesterase [Anaerolineae bacterium]